MGSTPVPDPTHRKRELPQNELEASSQLKLGEFQNVPTLSLSEARLVINKVLDLRKKSNNKYEERETLIKTQDYLEVFARFKEKENIEAVERLLSAHTELEFFERSQLGSEPTHQSFCFQAVADCRQEVYVAITRRKRKPLFQASEIKYQMRTYKSY
ncbi:DNA-directed RNA polymerase II 16 kDa polypeptide [Uncinocarpus reesii 1704]|uniref:DNA-directed RNA polymerase II 16 kDa polypeptide n=1 Tax=Uncinocarpus reesii (strain UAMH 1704) TaxID=336963 RepID=C4JHX0_UNCRE|nr:DNA-directed RNA polymerase II 16 kDa polypeptide [Uncinocarpus reesii 1704]EEP76546.1 DNA-directed RNA polymerase II 16 kDa polypeptide [Uncinocarpus reesii 1704]